MAARSTRPSSTSRWKARRNPRSKSWATSSAWPGPGVDTNPQTVPCPQRTQTESPTRATCEDDLDRHIRLSVSGVEGEFLSRENARGEDARLLLGMLPDHRNQLHLSSIAHRQGDRKLARPNIRTIPFHTQSAATDHRLSAPQELRGTAAGLR